MVNSNMLELNTGCESVVDMVYSYEALNIFEQVYDKLKTQLYIVIPMFTGTLMHMAKENLCLFECAVSISQPVYSPDLYLREHTWDMHGTVG